VSSNSMYIFIVQTPDGLLKVSEEMTS